MKTGRPSIYSVELADELCALVAAGGFVSDICRKNKHMPSERSVYQWKADRDDFSQKLAHAREERQEVFIKKIIEIAEKVLVEKATKTQKVIDPQRARVAMDAYDKACRLGQSKMIRGMRPENEDDVPLETKATTNRDRAKAVLTVFAGGKTANDDRVAKKA